MNYLENLLIYFSNLSTFYIFSVAISVAVVILTIYIGMVTRFTIGTSGEVAIDSKHQKNNSEDSGDGDEGSDGSDDGDFRRIESVSQIKTAKLKSLENSLTDEQRQEEREIERKQLAAIFELLKKQNKEFRLGSNLDEEDLHEQLNLYR
uniref:Protein with signal anchor n=1 Tax=Culex tarsalis TaxID=7177 RepID=A0A1Q3G525_CULTA